MTKYSFRRAAVVALTTASMLALAACGGGSSGNNPTEGGGGEAAGARIGFVAVGPEGGWRDANEKDVRAEFEEAGFELSYAGKAGNDQASQIADFSAFVDQGVDAIVLSATEATGWENSLQAAKDAEIPVILIDRMIDPDTRDLYFAHVSPDNKAVSASLAEWANAEFPDGANYVVLEGIAGLSVVNERNQGWDETINSNFTKLDSQNANWSTEEAKGIFATMLQANNNDIQLVFAQNDEMGIGAAQAARDAGLTPGVDVKILTIDGTSNVLQEMVDGNISVVALYSPFLGEAGVELVKKALAGESAENVIVDGALFDSVEKAQAELDRRQAGDIPF